ncbi:zinc ribbon domain-containing protein [Actinophytocola xanthii]|uniref:Zinc-ribbon domain-containing protein n=1 Tax=Actinophytocola xanthii TaxID=1912961 RepID=A0A1Q8CV24_9PSEU|nr:zinc ribbon domain-containing protein [Actinophytocola xanthii]OLF18199.1 hypothetical protein BU204_07625 [Actinophytocola xanthii]
MRPAAESCATCGVPLSDGQRFCERCGTPVGGGPAPSRAPDVVSRLLASHRADPRAAWFHLGAVLLGQDRWEEARSALERARDEPGSEPSDAEIRVLLAWALTGRTEPGVALQAYLEAVLLDPSLAPDVLPAAEELLSAEEARVLGPWIRSTWLPGMRAAVPHTGDGSGADLDIAALDLFRTRLAVLAGDAEEASAALADALRAGTPADSLGARSMPPLREAEWALLVAMALQLTGDVEGALRAVRRSREGALPEAGPFGAAEALVVEADLTADPREADLRRYEAARLFATRGEHERAIALFGRAARSWGDVAELHWAWADSIRVATYRASGPAVLESYQRIVDRWWAGTELELPDGPSAWAYLVPGFACETLAWNSPGRPRDELWRACLWAERALVLDERNLPALLLLARTHRQLENYAVAMVSVLTAQATAPEGFADAEDEYASLLDYVMPDSALEPLAAAAERAGPEDVRGRWALALALARAGRETEATAELDLLEPDPDDPWQLWAHGWVPRVFGHDAVAAERFARLRAVSTEDTAWTWFRAYAAYGLGEHEAAAAEMLAALPWVDTSSHRRHDYLVLAGLARLAQGRLEEGEELLREGAEIIGAIRDARDGATDLRALAARMGDGPAADAAGRLVEVFERRAVALTGRPLDVDGARAEMVEVAARGEDPAALTARATLARLSSTAHLTHAISTYTGLLAEREAFPEAVLGLCQVAFAHIDHAFGRGEPAVVLERIDQLREPLTGLADPRLDGVELNLQAREALARFWAGEPDAGRDRLTEVLEAGAGLESPDAELADFWATLLPDAEVYWRIVDILDGVADDRVHALAGLLAGHADRFLGCADDDPAPDYAPCEVRLGSGLVPVTGLPGSPLVTSSLLAVCDEVQAAHGVLVPLVTVSEDPSLSAHEYEIDLWGEVCGVRHVDPSTSDVEGEVAAGFRAVLGENLPALVVLDSADLLRASWVAEWPELTAPVDGDATLLVLAEVCRALLARGLPLRGRVVLEAFAASPPGAEVEEIVERCTHLLEPAVPEPAP